jgi:2-oxoglutarate ferredoxin oxidoreductase subunit delta
MAAKGMIVIDRNLCKECHLCIQACRQGCIQPGREFNPKGYRPVETAEDAKCTGCALCGTICPEVAIEVYRE